jgi:hypothetical protein
MRIGIVGAGGVGAAPGAAPGVGTAFATTACGVGNSAASLEVAVAAGTGGAACTAEQVRARRAAGTSRDGSFIAGFRPADNKALIVADDAGQYTGKSGSR